jgi:mono/diheme cytochrome c family protein
LKEQQEFQMIANVLRWVSIVISAIAFHTVSWAQDIGNFEYRIACAPCHGTDGKGKGPMSAQLKVAPADLTVLSKKNNGVLPISAIYEIIDGRQSIAAHGTRDMPIWGLRYGPDPIRSIGSPYASSSFFELSGDPEFIQRTRILAVIDYLNRIQEK